MRDKVLLLPCLLLLLAIVLSTVRCSKIRLAVRRLWRHLRLERHCTLEIRSHIVTLLLILWPSRLSPLGLIGLPLPRSLPMRDKLLYPGGCVVICE